jgi:hypothetical protein
VLLVSLVSSALALTIPLRATHTEWITPGAAPAASAATTASVKASNPTTGATFDVSGELTATLREASGGGEVTFAGDPADTIRTWALYLIDSDGNVLGDPELVEVLFDGKGAAALAGTDGARVSGVTVNGTDALGDGWVGGLAVDVQDAGTEAAYVGIVELSADGAALATIPDLGILDLATYATFQGLGLDAIVALDRYRTRVEGDLAVEGVSVDTKGTVETGAELRWDLTFSRTTKDGAGGWTASELGTASYLQPVDGVKKKTGVAKRVDLTRKDVTYDVWDATYALAIEGDMRGLELAASLDAYDGDTLVASTDAVLLDPTGIEAKAGIDIAVKDDGDAYRIDVLNSYGKLVSQHYCALAPTAATLADPEVDTWVGGCTQDDDAQLVLRPIKRSRKDTSIRHLNAQIRSRVQPDACTTCTTTTSSLLAGKLAFYDADGGFLGSSLLAVTETEWDVVGGFAADVDGLTPVQRFELDYPANVKFAWTVDANGDATGLLGATALYAIPASAVSGAGTGLYTFTKGDAGDEPAFRLSTGPGAGTGTGTLTIQANTTDYVPVMRKKRMIAGSNGGPSTF